MINWLKKLFRRSKTERKILIARITHVDGDRKTGEAQ